ncbi:MAG TPA: cytochrome o ubiquinol oxidase subunit IV [Gallionellaceae bacterium]|nr:cytochrome o ubiquinol oxidase subunit IV [Gallionellaceae bacterium]
MQIDQTHSHGSYRGNTIGFIISLLLTLASFGMVMSGKLPVSISLTAIVILAILQLIAQMHFFLHLDSSPSQRWNVMVLIYTLIIIVFIVTGTLWIMYNTNIRMMPMLH